MTTKKLSGNTIKSLQAGTDHAALIQSADGSYTAAADLRSFSLADTDVVLRHPAREWADELVALARLAAEEDGTPTALGTLRATAALLAADELAEDAAREAIPPRQRPVVAVLRPRGRRAAPQTEQTREAETLALCLLLDELEEAGLLRAA